jgi:putative ABC transport system permease protein
VLGLSVGITACLVIFLFVRFELSFDTFNHNADRIVRIDWEVYLNDAHTYNAAVTPPMAEAFVREFPEVEAAARFRFMGSFQFKRNTENLVEAQVIYADNAAFKIFSFPFIAGNPEHALTQPHSMVITESCAARFFPGENALGKTLIKDNEILYTVTGIIRDMPQNSHFNYQIFLSMEGLPEAKNGNWIGGPFNTYLLLRPNSDLELLEKKLTTIVTKYVVPHAGTVLGEEFMDQFSKGKNSLTLHVMPLTDIHLRSHLRNELGANGDIKQVYLISLVAVFILVLAVVNFTNLATARSIKRAREIGIRKVMGSSRINLTLQFIAESVWLSLLAFVIALALTELTLPFFNSIIGVHLHVPFNSPLVMLGFLSAAVCVGAVAGVYPGLVLSAYKPTEVLKGKVLASDSASFLRSGLVVFQFAVSIFLIIGTLAISSQTHFLEQVNLGFHKEQLLRMKDVGNSGDRLFAFRDEMLKNPLISSATISSYFPGPGSARQTPLVWKYGTDPLPSNAINIEKWWVDQDYVSSMGMEIFLGRDFSRDFSDSAGVIINQSAARNLGLSANPVGEKLTLFHDNPDGSQDPSRLESYTIIGVVKDFNYESLQQEIQPLGLFFGRSMNSIAFRYDARHTQDVIDALKATWNKVSPDAPFHYSFLDEDFQKTFSTEKKLGRIFGLFSSLAISIACLGLFALTAFTAEQRTKEIGIRKVLGASITQVVTLLSLSFGRLVLIGFLFAAPLAAFGVHWYLQQYAYRTKISPWLYLEAGLLAFLLSALTIGYQSIKTARRNPTDSLKHE